MTEKGDNYTSLLNLAFKIKFLSAIRGLQYSRENRASNLVYPFEKSSLIAHKTGKLALIALNLIKDTNP